MTGWKPVDRFSILPLVGHSFVDNSSVDHISSGIFHLSFAHDIAMSVFYEMIQKGLYAMILAMNPAEYCCDRLVALMICPSNPDIFPFSAAAPLLTVPMALLSETGTYVFFRVQQCSRNACT